MGRKRPLRSVRCTVAAFKFTGSPTRTKMPVHCGRGHCAAQENDRRCHNDEWTRLMSHDLIQFRGRQTEFQALPESCRWNAVSVLFVPRRRKRRQCRKNTDLAANRIISARRCRAAPPEDRKSRPLFLLSFSTKHTLPKMLQFLTDRPSSMSRLRQLRHLELTSRGQRDPPTAFA